MKILTIFFSIFLLKVIAVHSQVPTDAGIPDANHVLVVYNSNSDTSFMVANYYKNARNIPASNIVGIYLPDTTVTIDGSTHKVKIVQVTDVIQDSVNNANNVGTTTKHSFKYFLDNISTPIRNWITSHNLTSIIRYIVLCKGVPFKIQSSGDYASGYRKGNVTVDGLLCMLNTPDYDSLILNTALFSETPISNPYKNVDPNFTMDFRFLPDHFISDQGYNLSYLVSHLDGISFEVVKGIIDRSIDPDMSGTASWVIDDDPTWSGGHFSDASDKLDELGFNVFYDDSHTWITHYPENVMGYTSWGTHAEDRNCAWEDSAWVKDSLKFTLANGSVFNTYESFNGNSLTTLKWRYVPRVPLDCNHTQGLATQFTEIGGTATMGHAWEPGVLGVVENQIFFPAYQLGYNLIDAYYQGLPNLSSNILVGDPLLRIFNCENIVISTNTTIGSGEYNCNLIVPLNVKLTVQAGSIVNFKRNAKLKMYGTLELAEDAILNFDVYSRFELEGNLTMSGNSAHINFNDESVFKTKNISVINSLNITCNDNSKFYVNENGTLITYLENSFTFNDYSRLYIEGKLIVNEGNSFIFNNSSGMEVSNKIYFNAGSEISFNENSFINVFGTFISKGQSEINDVVFNFSGNTSYQLLISNPDTALIDFTTFNENGLNLSVDQVGVVKHINISNSFFESARNPLYIACKNVIDEPITISHCNFNNCGGTGMRILQVPEIIIENCNINLISDVISTKGIVLKNNGSVDIIDCNITGGGIGIESLVNAEDDIEIIEELETDIFVSKCLFENLNSGIIIDNQQAPYNSVDIFANHFTNCTFGVTIDEFFDCSPSISENIIYGNSNGNSDYGIILTNGREVVVANNSIKNFRNGINLNSVNQPYLLANNISAIDLTVEPLSGITAVSSNGEIRNNTIQFHKTGIELGSSSPKIGANTITDNDEYGIYISDNSNPDLSGSFVGDDKYPLSGYNTIRENGKCDIMKNSELYLLESSVVLEKGCNTIADDREMDPINGCDYLYLIDGRKIPEMIIKARGNYWGNHPVYGNDPTGRFGEEVTIDYSDYLREPCTYSQGSTELILANSKGEVYDTVYSTGNTASGLSDIEIRYATANNYYYNNQYNQAKQEYEGIIQNYGNDKASIQAYNRLYTIASLTNSSPSVFTQLKDYYLQQASNQTDSLMIGTLTHLGDLCLVSAEEYITAINNFDEIAQQNPNTDIALYRQIDALTTSLLIPQDSTLNKGILGKYSVNGLSDYTNKLSELLKTRGKSGLDSEKELLPTEFTLYQNYPNPFNPITTIKYDLPKTTDVSLIIYDILGRKVKELVNAKQEAGRYEVQFNATNLASGVYIYQLFTEKYLSSKKMILMK